MKKNKKIVFVLLAFVCFFASFESVCAGSDVHSTISGEIIAGELSFSKPNDIRFHATLNGQKQVINLEKIRTQVSDYRGIEDGWQLTVKSPNFYEYKANYQLQMNKKQITDTAVIVYLNEKQLMKKELALPTNVEISAKAKAGSYSADLEWNLQPNIKKIIKE